MSRMALVGFLALLSLVIGFAVPSAVDSVGGDGLLTASDGDKLDGFGRAVAINGATLAVATPPARRGARRWSRVRCMSLRAAGWVGEAVLKPPEQGVGELLGRSVVVSGDVIVAGAHGEDSAGVLAGAAYVFERGAGGWTQTAKLVGADTTGSDLFGWAVAVDGETIAVGARNQDSGGSNAGTMYVFGREGGGWSQAAKLTAACRPRVVRATHR